MENIVILGAGPAGLTAAIYAARADLAPVVVEGRTPGGQLLVASLVENYPGFPEGISGFMLMEFFRKQAQYFKAKLLSGEITAVNPIEGGYLLSRGEEKIETRTVIIATGARARRLRIPSEPRFYGKGVSGCATCDGALFRNQDLVVVGGGGTAMQDAVFLTRFAKSVTIVHRREYLRAEPIEAERARNNPKIKWLIPWVVEEITGEDTVTGVILRNPETGARQRLMCGGVFVAIGYEPETALFRGLVDLDENGFVKLDRGSSKTRAPGVFACGDVCALPYKQAVIAAGTGCIAALDAQKFLEDGDST